MHSKRMMGFAAFLLSGAIILSACGSSTGLSENQMAAIQLKAAMSEWSTAGGLMHYQLSQLPPNPTKEQLEADTYQFLVANNVVLNILEKETWPVSVQPQIKQIESGLYLMSSEIQKIPSLASDPAAQRAQWQKVNDVAARLVKSVDQIRKILN